MENFISALTIHNFKSIRNVVLHPRRVNLIIGSPNVGKSTLLEAISLLGSWPFANDKKKDPFMHEFLRYHKPPQLFHDGAVESVIRVESDRDVALLGSRGTGRGFHYASLSQAAFQALGGTPDGAACLARLKTATRESTDAAVLQACAQHQKKQQAQAYEDCPPLEPLEGHYVALNHRGWVRRKSKTDNNAHAPDEPMPPAWLPRPVKPYRFSRNTDLAQRRPDCGLWPPFGDNLVQVLEHNAGLRHEYTQLFAENGLLLRVRADARRFEVAKEIEGVLHTYPYAGTGDTLQRFGFYLAAMHSSQHTVLLFEEPEAHSYPTYITQMGDRIAKSTDNQFFITTHSPYLFTEVLDRMVPYENRCPELAVFVAYYEDFETKLRELSDEEVRDIRREPFDSFYNLDRFVHQAAGKLLTAAESN